MTERTTAPAPVSYDPNCTRCPRLAAFLSETRARLPGYWARPVPSFGDPQARILIVGLAPGLHGANRTARPFTGDHAGILLYQTLYDAGLATLPTSTSADDPLRLVNARIVNSVKCVPPQNKPLPEEVRTCNAYLSRELGESARARVYLALGRIAHEAVLMARGARRAEFVFGHAAEHVLAGGVHLIDSYHCSRYNTQTRRLTEAMFRSVIARACELAQLPVPPRLRAA
ncbi:MAG: uracil-DNA glycosylase [Proteobacteria bacterium]|nr:uracil-DNA glycosylase [Pseudomonadota bacterium]